jgi:hypothetical protein
VNIEISSSEELVAIPDENSNNVDLTVVDAVQGEEMNVEENVEVNVEVIVDNGNEGESEKKEEEAVPLVVSEQTLNNEDSNPTLPTAEDQGDDNNSHDGEPVQVENAEKAIVQQDADIVMSEEPSPAVEDDKVKAAEECN